MNRLAKRIANARKKIKKIIFILLDIPLDDSQIVS